MSGGLCFGRSLMSHSSFNLNRIEKRAAVAVCGIYMARMLGLFMALPVLALADEHFADATPLLIGLALGIYGLPQAFCRFRLAPGRTGLAGSRS